MTSAPVLVSVDVTKVEAALKRIGHVIGQIPEGTSREIHTLTEFALTQVKKRTPGSGAFREAWTSELMRPGGRRIVIEVFNRWAREGKVANDYGTTWTQILNFLEFGTVPHFIRPRDPQGVLVFTVDDGTVVFAKSVAHPGTRPYRMVSLTEENMKRMIGHTVQRLSARIHREWEARSRGETRGGN